VIKYLKETNMIQEKHSGKRGFFGSPANIVLVGFLAIGGYFLLAEYGAHMIPFLPWRLLLACPLMHLFMHHGHHGTDHQANPGDHGDHKEGAT